MYGTVDYKPTGSLAGLLFKNAPLNLVTVFIYRFWAKTAVRRYLWQAVRLNGEPFEYTGLGRELLIGFLIVVAVLAPAALAWGLLNAALQSDPAVLAISKTLYALVLYILILAAGFRARRYRLSRTRWRGIRAAQTGSTWRYIFMALGWSLVTVLTFGLAAPWMRTALQRYRTTHTWFGNERFAFDAPARPLLLPWLAVLAAAAVPLAVMAVFLVPFVIELIAAAGSGDTAATKQVTTAHAGKLMLLVVTPYLCVAIGGVAYVWYRVREFRHFAAHTRLGTLTFRSNASGGRIVGRVLLCVLACLGGVIGVFVIAVVGAIIFGAFSGIFHAAGPSQGTAPGANAYITGIVVGIVVVTLMLFLFRLLWTLMVTVGTLRHLCATLAVDGIEGLDRIAQSPAPAPKFGEGLADSFDLGAA